MRLARLIDVFTRLLSLVMLCTAVAAAFSPSAAAAAVPPLPIIVTPDPVQARLQAQIAVQQAQAQARLAVDQARVQAQLDANQARLQGQLAAQQAGTQAQPAGARQGPLTAAQLAALSLPMGGPMEQPWGRPPGTMELTTLTPGLGHYFGTDHGVLVVRAPTRGVLKLQDGDVILSIGGRVPADSSQAMRILTSYDPGDKIRLVILREHRRMDIMAIMPAPPPSP
jgi:multidrug efflux pump subunit AcrA (membrane-fusion protein)